MGFFDLFKAADISSQIEEYKATEGAVLLDVRTREEYSGGHIPGGINIPVSEIAEAETRFEKSTPVFTYCQSGARSGRAVAALRQMGFENVRNIGGIAGYRGEIER